MKPLAGLVAAAIIVSTNLTSAQAHDLGEKVDLSKEPVSYSDELASVFQEDNVTYRCLTKNGEIMEVDHTKDGTNLYGNTIGKIFNGSPANILPVYSWNNRNKSYSTYLDKEKRIIRFMYNSKTKIVEEITVFIHEL